MSVKVIEDSEYEQKKILNEIKLIKTNLDEIIQNGSI